METNRQKKVGGVLQRDLVDVIQKALAQAGVTGIIVSVSKVGVTTDLSQAKVYMSVFPHDKAAEMLVEVKAVKPFIKHEIAQRTRHQLRRMPELQFYIDDSLEYIDGIDKSLKGTEDPIENPDLLPRRKKS
ncbi:30S ribosome-binding factor RbfA [Leeuwenhoekiella aequorea]|uniref:Ribosome-binding factor A n=2 Tax=Flavobacteriia TaxID=117743 RepID=A0A4Q0PDZ9_9FLAO|nr:30S ribosome-binding factor RbfA [Leeuwenhoekiella aequorea]AOE06008.1 ribosome-binding factor A [uncultured bacterium]RXG24309.1 ribosome-binding factor A [Leeuwenhoekiella aequorea]CCF99581.1 ribosome-binding factor A [uncultured Flavobacteriia bacterium]CCF99824.1 ribosome-binding factor A [uncultured Flavobacteriia bacterium]|tara:strand:+ start:1555 stop:1947 length:393 start_codon:yes stop_codon:yes gene_type:complete